MDFWQAVRVILVRWYVFVPVVILSILASLMLSGSIGAEYRADASVMFIGPNEQIFLNEDDEEESQFVNPFLSLSSGSLAATANAVQLSLESDATELFLKANGLSPAFEIDRFQASPILMITVQADGPGTAAATVDALIALTESRLREFQQAVNAPEEDYITASVLNQTEVIEPGFTARRRFQVLVIVMGLMMGAGAAFGIDGLLSMRFKRLGGGVDVAAGPATPLVPAPAATAAAPTPVAEEVEPEREPEPALTAPAASRGSSRTARTRSISRDLGSWRRSSARTGR